MDIQQKERLIRRISLCKEQISVCRKHIKDAWQNIEFWDEQLYLAEQELNGQKEFFKNEEISKENGK